MDLSNLLAHWKLSEGGAAIRLNSHVTAPQYQLSNANSPSSVAGKLGAANDFNGTNQYLYDFNSGYHPGTDFEINGWVKFDALTVGSPVIWGGGPAFGTKSYLIYTDGTNLRFAVSDDGVSFTTEAVSTVTLSTGGWFFFRCWYDDFNEQIGIRVNTETIVTASHTTGIFTDVFPGNYLLFGLRGDTIGFLNGQLDSISFWTRVLTQTEGECVYNSDIGLDYPWPCVVAAIPSISFFDAIKLPTLTPIVLAEVTVGIWCRAWIVDGTLTNTYKVSVERENARGETFSLNITSVKWNLTTELTLRASASSVNSNAGSWFSDGTYLWVRPPTGESIFSNTIQAFATFYFSQIARTLNNIFWEPRLSSVPNLSQRIEAKFGGIAQIGGGSMTLFNHDGYFNQMQDFQWHHGTVVIKLGIDVPKQVMDWQDYQTIATWHIRDWRRDETNFTLNLIEPKAKVKTKVPFTFFDRATYPNIEDSLVGKPVPIAYGRIYGIAPKLINPGTKTFLVASHAIKSFDGVRIKKSREEKRTITTAVGDWQPYSGTVYRYYLSGETAENVAFDAVSLAEENSVDDVVAAAGSWASSENYIYVNPSTGETMDSGVYTIDAVKTVDGFVTSNFASVDAVNAQFTLGNDWAVGTEVSVDFRGKPNADGSLMENPSDIVADLLDVVGETNVDAASFATARERFRIGNDENGSETHRHRPSVYIEDATEVLEIIGLINEVCGCFLFSDELGRFHLGAFQPEVGESTPLYTDLDLMDFEELSDSEELISKLVASWQERKLDAYSQVETTEQVSRQYIAGQPQPVIEEKTVSLTEENDIEYWSQRELIMRGVPLKLFTFRLPWNALLRKPGEQIHIQSDARQLDEVFEIYEVRRDLSTKQVTLIVGNLRNYADTPGFWVDDAAVLPTRFSQLTGYSAGSLVWNTAWDTTIKKWVRQNVGYWTDANGFAATADPESFLPSVWV